MKKLYAVSDKKGNPTCFGNQKRSSWTKGHWITYHVQHRIQRFDGFHVNIVDLLNGTY
jgi:hypothetical protein